MRENCSEFKIFIFYFKLIVNFEQISPFFFFFLIFPLLADSFHWYKIACSYSKEGDLYWEEDSLRNFKFVVTVS